jgi:hypothetical protein
MWGAAPILAAATTTLTSGEVWAIAAASGLVGYAFAVYSRRVTGSYPWRVPALIWGLLGVLVPVISLLLEAVARLTTRPVPPPAADPFGPSDYFSASAAPGTPGASDPSSPGNAWPPPDPQWQPPPAPAPQWQPPTAEHQQPGAPGPEIDQAGVPNWQVGTPVGPAAPPWPPPLGPEAFPPAPGQGFPAAPPYAGPGDPSSTWQPPEAQVYPARTQPGLAAPEGWSQPLPYVPAATPPPLFGWYPDPTGRHEERYWDGRLWSHRVSDNAVRSDDPLHLEATPGTTPDAATPPLIGPSVPPDQAGSGSTTA